MTGKRRECAAATSSKKGCGRADGSGEKLTEQFFADFARLWQERGCEVLHQLIAERPLDYFRAMVKLALVLHSGSPRLRGVERRRNRDAVLRLLKNQEKLPACSS